MHIYQYEIGPFCNKVKALLDLQRLPYETTEVNPLTKGETKAWSGGYRKVPIALLEGEQGTTRRSSAPTAARQDGRERR